MLNGTEANAVTPSISATLEYLKGPNSSMKQSWTISASSYQNCDLSEPVVDKYITFKLSATKG